MLLPEGQALSSRMRVDGRLEVQAMPMIDPSLGTIEELQQLRELLVKFSPATESLPPGQKPAGELLPGDDVR